MPAGRMVPVVRVQQGFEARVVAARLGSEGIVTQFRGPVEGPYPVGAVEVLVAEDELAEARAILDAGASAVPGDDELGEPDHDRPGASRGLPVAVLAFLALVVLALALATVSGSWPGR